MLQCHKYKFKSCKNQFDKKLHAVDRYIKKVELFSLRLPRQTTTASCTSVTTVFSASSVAVC